MITKPRDLEVHWHFLPRTAMMRRLFKPNRNWWQELGLTCHIKIEATNHRIGVHSISKETKNKITMSAQKIMYTVSWGQKKIGLSCWIFTERPTINAARYCNTKESSACYADKMRVKLNNGRFCSTTILNLVLHVTLKRQNLIWKIEWEKVDHTP